jgi:HD superfamily phosphodiesterase
MKTKLIFIFFAFLTQVVLAQNSKHEIYDQMIIEGINVATRTVTIKGVEYSYSMIDVEDAFYVSESKTRNLKYLPVKRKYYVNIEYANSTDFLKKNQKGVVTYIGLVKQPF